MSSSYPGTIDSFTNPGAGSLVTNPSHAQQHTDINTSVISIENVLGTTGGTSVLKNFTAGNFAERVGTLTFGAATYGLGTAALSAGQALTYNGTQVVGSATGGASPLTTKGDLFTYSSAGTRLAVGADARILNADSSTATGLAWVNSLNTFQFGTVVTNRLSASTSSGIISATNAIKPATFTLADNPGGTIDMTFGGTASPEVCYLVLGTTAGIRVFGTPNAINNSGQSLWIGVKQNTNNTGTVDYQGGTGVYRLNDSFNSQIGTNSTWNWFNWRYNGIDSKYDFISQTLNII